MMLRESSLLWLPAARSGFAVPGNWVEWADRHIEQNDCPPSWLLDVSVAQDCEALTKALLDGCPELPADDPDSLLGYVWLRHEVKSEPLDVVLRLAAELADAYDANLACEDIYGAFRNLEAAEHQSHHKAAMDRIGSMFSEYRDVAMEQWERLQV